MKEKKEGRERWEKKKYWEIGTVIVYQDGIGWDRRWERRWGRRLERRWGRRWDRRWGRRWGRKWGDGNGEGDGTRQVYGRVRTTQDFFKNIGVHIQQKNK